MNPQINPSEVRIEIGLSRFSRITKQKCGGLSQEQQSLKMRIAWEIWVAEHVTKWYQMTPIQFPH